MFRAAAATIFISFITLAGSSRAFAAEGGAAGWLGLQLRVPFAERYAVQMLTEPRLFENGGDLRILLLRPWVSVALPHGFGAGLGYDALLFWNPTDRQEHRIWQQGSHQYDFGRVVAQSRFRLEERLFSDDASVSVRGRLLLGASVDLVHGFALRVFNESFVNFNDVSRLGPQGYSENRLYGGVGRRFNPWFRTALGYQMQWLDAQPVDLFNHTIMILASFDIVLGRRPPPEKRDEGLAPQEGSASSEAAPREALAGAALCLGSQEPNGPPRNCARVRTMISRV